MEFRILGHLEIVYNGQPVKIGSRRLQALLVGLLLQANSVVSVERLIDLMWSEQPPRSARSTLQTYVHRLRRLLADCPEVVLRTNSVGYALRIPAQALDLGRFEAIVAEGREAIERGRVAEGVARLRAGLAIWRGRALADFREERLQADARRLDELRVTIQEEALHAELTLGRHDQVLLELDALVAAHPYRERLWGWLMVALYRSGRQADALKVYQQARRTLRDGLGIEPGAELRDLQRRMLAGVSAAEFAPRVHAGAAVPLAVPLAAPSAVPLAGSLPGSLPGAPAVPLTGPGPAAVAAPTADVRPARAVPARAVPAPVELPADVTSFTGRGAELARLHRLLGYDEEGSVSIAVLSGPAGVGKSALATHAAHRFAAQFVDGVFYADLKGTALHTPPSAAAQVLRRWLLYYVHRADIPVDTDDAAALFRSLVFRQRILVLLDNAASATQVRPLLPAGPAGKALITTRRPIVAFDNAAYLTLRPFDEAESTEFLTGLVGPERTVREPEALATIVRMCERLPLALRIAAARLIGEQWPSIGAFARRLGEDRHRLDELTHGDLGVRPALRASYLQLQGDRVGRQAAGLLRLIGLLNRTHIDLPRAARLARESADWTEVLLDRLMGWHLLDRDPADQGYRLPDLVRLFAREQTLIRAPGGRSGVASPALARSAVRAAGV